jgi:DNA-binding protein HU-beta
MEADKGTMTKADLIDELAGRTGYSKAIIHEIINEFFQVVKESILNNLSVQVRGFGTFFRKKKASKKARNLSKNIPMTIPAHEVPAFKPSKDFQNCLKGQ